jgi:hypothetical protein
MMILLIVLPVRPPSIPAAASQVPTHRIRCLECSRLRLLSSTDDALTLHVYMHVCNMSCI